MRDMRRGTDGQYRAAPRQMTRRRLAAMGPPVAMPGIWKRQRTAAVLGQIITKKLSTTEDTEDTEVKTHRASSSVSFVSSGVESSPVLRRRRTHLPARGARVFLEPTHHVQLRADVVRRL